MKTTIAIGLLVALSIGALVFGTSQTSINRQAEGLQSRVFKKAEDSAAIVQQQNHILGQLSVEGNAAKDIEELSKLAAEVEKVMAKTNFDYKNMSEKEYEDSIELLRAYNERMRKFLDDEEAERL